MKKAITIIAVALLVFPFNAVFANSGPVYMSSFPSSDVLAVDNNTPIEVNGEDLTFDFSAKEEHYSPIGMVTAEYKMANPTHEDLSVQMAFPFIENLGSISNDNIKITADNEELSYEIYLGGIIKRTNINGSEETDENYFNFEKIIETITDNSYKTNNFTEDELGKLYSIEVKPSSDKEVEIAVDLTFDYEKTKVFAGGFNGFSREGKTTKITSWCRKPIVLDIYVLGEDVDFSIAGYTDGTLKEKTDLYMYEIHEKEIDVRTFLLSYIKNNSYISYDNISDIQLYNVFAKGMDEQFSNNLGFCIADEVLTYGSISRMITLVYTVEFPKNSEKTVSVSYKTTGTMDRRDTKEPVYTYDYILNPAENWKDFKNLNIKIIPPADAPYIVDSSIELNKEDNIYTASLKSLPNDDFTFTLYHKDKITMMDKLEGKINRTFGYFAPVVMGFILILLVIIIIIKVKIRKKHKLK